MIFVPRSVRFHLAVAPASPRKSFEGLSNEVRTVLAADPLSGHVFIFLNRTRTQVKLLVWTRGGFTITHKRLERGRFTFPSRAVADARSIEIDAHELAALLEGLDIGTARSAKRWNPPLPGTRLAGENQRSVA